MRSEVGSVVVAMVFAAGITSGGACGGGSSEGGTGGSGAGGMQTASGGAGGGKSCTGPVTEAQAAAMCAQAAAGTSVFLIVDADCGTAIFSSDDLHPGITPVSALVGTDGGRHDAGPAAGGAPDAGLSDAGGRPDAELVDAGLPSIGSIVVSDSVAGEIQLHNRTGIPAGPQALVPAGNGTSLMVAVPQNFGSANGTTLQVCRAQSGDVNVTLPSDLSGVGAAASFTAHCQPYAADGGTPPKDAGVGNPPAKNLVGCFRS